MVASYPYDDSRTNQGSGYYSRSPDDEFFKYVSIEYSRKHLFMHEGKDLCKGDEFPDGITNGAHWYDVPGGIQIFFFDYYLLL